MATSQELVQGMHADIYEFLNRPFAELLDDLGKALVEQVKLERELEQHSGTTTETEALERRVERQKSKVVAFAMALQTGHIVSDPELDTFVANWHQLRYQP